MILVTGGTGRLGSLLVDRLVRRGEDVRVMTRDVARATDRFGGRVQVVHGDVRNAASLPPALEGVGVVVSAVHGFTGPRGTSPATVDRAGNMNLIDAAVEARAGVVLLSTIGARADSPMELFRMKHAAEEHLRSSSTPWTIVRASAFAELWIEIVEATARRSGRPVVFGRGANPVNFVSVDDVAAVVEGAVVDPGTRGEVIEVGGPANLTLDQFAAMVQRAAGRDGATKHAPPAALWVMARTAGRVRPELGRQVRAALVMDSMDLRWDPAAVSAATARPGPTTVEQVLAGRSARV